MRQEVTFKRSRHCIFFKWNPLILQQVSHHLRSQICKESRGKTFLKRGTRQAWQCTLVILALKRWRPETQEPKGSLGFMLINVSLV